MADLRCPHCHAPLQLLPAHPSVPELGAAGQLLDLREAVRVYCTEQRVTGAWSAQWAPTAEAHLTRFATSGHPLDRPGVAQWKSTLLEAGKSPRTVNSHLASLGAFAQWLVSRGELLENPARGHAVKGKTRAAADERLAFEPHEVRALLDYTKTQAPQRGYWGLVWLMAYTGARNEEVAQLRFEDYRFLQGTQVFDLTTINDGQRRKTLASRRIVPVHTVLQEAMATLVPVVPNNAVQAGIERVDAGLDGDSRDGAVGTAVQGIQGSNLLGLTPREGRWAYSASRWVNDRALAKLKEDEKVRNDPRLTLYSLRHSVTTQLKHKGIPEDLLAELVGHTNTSLTTGRYGKRYPIERLKEVVNQLVW